MSPEEQERVFGRGRLKMKTGSHVEVFREAAVAGERRRYTKRFLATHDGDFRSWTEREWRILARLVGHGVRCVPEVVQFERGAGGMAALVQTFDAGITVDHWATLLPVAREGRVQRHVFEDAAHWWALAQHTLMALEQIQRLHLVHLDLKADNVCIPLVPPDFAPDRPGQILRPLFSELALIDFAFSIVTGEDMAMPLPIGWQQDYAYQSPRLLKALEAGRAGDLGPTRELDWRCDIFSLAAMLQRCLPSEATLADAPGWSGPRFEVAQRLLQRLHEIHDHGAPQDRPYPALIGHCAEVLHEPALAASLQRGWMLALDVRSAPAATPPTPVTRLAPPLSMQERSPMPQAVPSPASQQAESAARASSPPPGQPGPAKGAGKGARRWLGAGLAVLALVAAVPALLDRVDSWGEGAKQGSLPAKEIRSSRAREGSSRGREAAPVAPVENFEQRAQRLLGEHVPKVAAQLEGEVEDVLRIAARAHEAGEDRRVLNLARRVPRDPGTVFSGTRDVGDARRLNEEAREAFWMRQSVREAFRLQLRAFGANPGDTEVAGNLAFLHLKLEPPRAETARRLALYALSIGGRQFPAGRVEDWGTLAVSSALLGREREAENALFVMLALSRDLDRACRAALSAVANYGRTMRPPAEALLRRIWERGGSAAPACQWPPRWELGTRFP